MGDLSRLSCIRYLSFSVWAQEPRTRKLGKVVFDQFCRDVDRNLREAPKPELVARRILKLIDQKNPPPRVRVGGTFQATIAPFIFRFLPQRLRIWGLKQYYRLPN